jgi:type III restriction enzyme
VKKVPNSDLDGRPIVETPGICGGSPRIYGTRIPVRVLETLRRLGWSTFDFLENYPTINQADLEMAWAYIASNREKIEQEIRENNGSA